ncbi:hypothetical protein AB3662_12205 [Sorangium cellulosum]|uniref:nSTAND3 domain-containing NTPase n=1 Tax=Sorangium cellulosum TaxID=56 RepID=UPI003D9AA7DB
MVDPGRIAYRGFEYQIHATAWLLLSWLIDHQLGAVIEVEPLSGEDLELLRADEPTPDLGDRSTALHTEGGASRYIVQIKGRSAGDWGKSELNAILSGEDASSSEDEESAPNSPLTGRVRPLALLETDVEARFLFLTDGVLGKGLSSLRVQEPWFAPRALNPEGMPRSLKHASEGVAGRVGVLQQHPLKLIQTEAKEILQRCLHVPHAAREACLEAILGRVRRAMLDRKEAQITAAELRSMVAAHALPTESEPFVEPKSFDEVRRHLEKSHAIFLLGAPGVGKTRAAERLVLEHRSRAESFAVIRLDQNHSPTTLREYRSRTEPHLLFVSDPFGRYQQDPRSNDWLRELDALLGAVHPDLRVIVTSRTSFAKPPLEDKKSGLWLRKHAVVLREKDFDPAALLRAHLDHDKSIDGSTRGWLQEHALDIARRLTRPLSYQRLIDLAREVDAESRTEERIAEIIRAASNAELGQDLIKTFEAESNEVLMGLTAVWLALETWGQQAGDLKGHLDCLEEDLSDLGAEVTGASTKLRAHGWLRIRGDRWEMHPVYLEGCFQALKSRRQLVRRVAERLLDALLGRGDLSAVSSMWRALDGRELLKNTFTRKIRDVARSLLRAGSDGVMGSDIFVSAFTLLGAHGDVGHPVDALVMALTFSDDSESSGWGHTWRAPPWDAETWRAVKGEPATEAIVREWMRQGFPTMPSFLVTSSERALVTFLYQLADVSHEFDRLVEDIEGDFISDVIAEGAVRSRTADLGALFAQAITLHQEAEEWARTTERSDEDSYAEGDYLADEWYRRIKPAHALIDALLDEHARRGAHDWAARQTEPLVFERFAERIKSDKVCAAQVVADVIAACPADGKAEIVKAVLQQARLLDVALAALPSLPPHTWGSIVRDGLGVDDAAPSDDQERRWREVVLPAAQRLTPEEQIIVAFDVSTSEATSELARQICGYLEVDARDALDALGAARPRDLSPAAATLLERICDSPADAAGPALRALAAAGHSVDSRITQWLAPDAVVSRGTAALDAAAVLPQSDAVRLLSHGIQHRRARVRKHAISLLEAHADESATAALVQAALDPVASVRIQAANALSGRPARAAWEALLELLNDRTDTSEAARMGHGWGDEHHPEYGVAVAAANALDRLDPWPAELVSTIDEALKPDASKPLMRRTARTLQKMRATHKKS